MSDAVVVIDYGMGNLFSVESALRYLGAEVTLSADPEVVESARQVILPGVGSFRLAMNDSLRDILMRPFNDLLLAAINCSEFASACSYSALLHPRTVRRPVSA